MNGEDFVIALLMMADEHDGNADTYEMLVSESTHGIWKQLSDGWSKSAAEQRGLADVYKTFAEIITNQMAVERIREYQEYALARYMDFYRGLPVI